MNLLTRLSRSKRKGSNIGETEEGHIMTRTMLGLVALLLILCTGIPAHSQGIEWETLNDEVISLYRQGLYDRAVVVAKKALQVAEQAVGPDHPSVATSLSNLALLYKTQGQYAQAEPLYRRALVIQEKALGPDHPDVARNINIISFWSMIVRAIAHFDKSQNITRSSSSLRVAISKIVIS